MSWWQVESLNFLRQLALHLLSLGFLGRKPSIVLLEKLVPRSHIQVSLFDVHDILNYDPVHWESRNLLPRKPIDILSFQPVRKPSSTREVNGLSNVEPGAEPSMVASWLSHNELAGLLKCLVNFDLNTVFI